MIRFLSSTLSLVLSACVPADPSGTIEAEKLCSGRPVNEMVWVPGGDFVMGQDPQYPEEGPPRNVSVDGFWIGAFEITNDEFSEFVKATRYITLAERDPPRIQGVPPEMLKPGSAVFTVPTLTDRRWWKWETGAQWRHPSGLNETIEGRSRDPVVQIAYQDALAYAEWIGKDLPSEEQWEYAARGGEETLPDLDDEKGDPQANYYQGLFPLENSNIDGFIGRAPVGCFEPNNYGLYDMIGNVWEWTSQSGARGDTREQVNVIKGGSYLCAANYCARYRPAARQFQERSLGTDHIGFRIVDNTRSAPT